MQIPGKHDKFFIVLLCSICLIFGIAHVVSARVEKPSMIAEEFYRCLRYKKYKAAIDLLSSADKRNFAALQTGFPSRSPDADPDGSAVQTGAPPRLADILSEQFFLMYGQKNEKMIRKSQSGETIMPQRIGFFVPGQYYIVGNFAVVFTRETYEIAPADTGPVRDDPRKLWVDPTNVLSKIRDEAYFKRWWVWKDNRLTMPGLLWMVKENKQWKIDLFSGVVPRKAFRGILRWHFGREVFKEPKSGTTSGKSGVPASRPSAPKK